MGSVGGDSSIATDPMEKFNKGAEFTFHPDVEGGYTVDQGGPTNYGITQETLNNFNKAGGYPAMDVKDMTPDDAKFVAHREFFDKPGFGVLPDRLAVAAFDYGINSGAHQAVLDLQRSVGVVADGKMGPKTLAAVNNYVASNGEDALLQDYIGRRSQLMGKLVASNPQKYGGSALGWVHRIQKLKGYLGVKDPVADTATDVSTTAIPTATEDGGG